MAALLERAVKAVHKDKADQLMPVLGKAFAARIGEGVQSGFAKNPFEVAWNTPDGEMIRHLQANVYEFSFAKSYQQLRALTQALYGKDGHIIPFHEFREVAIRINNEVAVRHLETEYNTAIASAQMASRWVQFDADKKEFPLLTYQTVGDGSVRPSHAALDGVTRPVEDPFWSEYYPPNGWGCRCDVIQAIGRRATPAEKIAIPEDVPALFKTNTAKGGLVFPEGHPYFEQLPAEVTKAASGSNPFWSEYYPPNGWGCRCDVIQAIGRRATPAEKIAIPEDVPALFKTNTAKGGLVFPEGHPYFEQLPAEVTKAASGSNPFAYEKAYTGKRGGYVYDNAVHNTSAEEMYMAKALADNGHRVIMLPEVPADTDGQRRLRELCLPKGVREGKTPDARVNDQLMEFKTNKSATYESIDNALKKADQKAETLNVCLHLTKPINSKILKRAMADRLRKAKGIQEVWIIDTKGKVKKYLRDNLIN